MAKPVTQGQVIRSEWIKLRTVRSSWFVLGATVLGLVVVGLLVSYITNARWSASSASSRADFNPINQDLIGVNVAELTVGVLGVLITFLGGQAMLGSHGIWIGHPAAVRAVFGSALYLTVVAVLGLGLGFLIRSTAGGIATLIAVLLVLPVMVAALPGSVAFGRYLPSTAGRAIFIMNSGHAMLSPWAGFGIFLLYTVVVVAAAALSLRRRDA